MARSAFGALNIKIQEHLHYALFLLLLATIHVIAKTNTRTTTVAATTTMTLKDVVPAEITLLSVQTSTYAVESRLTGEWGAV